jgi:EAL domain-containing protein (putative c-di-GMP-specific phosphodiesterase class I)
MREPPASSPPVVPLDALRFQFQPVVAIGAGATGWHEALIRWHLPDGTVRGPLDVLPYWLAPIRLPAFTEFTVQSAAESLQAHPDARLSVNLSPRQVTHPVVLRLLEALLPTVRGRLIVELTEQRYRDLVGLWSSLATLGADLDVVLLDDVTCDDLRRRWRIDAPVDGIKLDRSVLARLLDPDDREGVSRLVREAAGRYAIVVAEGIEDAAQLEVLEGLGVTHVQGFGLGRPGPHLVADASARVLVQNRSKVTPCGPRPDVPPPGSSRSAGDSGD